MTISTTTVSQSYSGNGSTTAFTFPFPINSTSEIKVIERSATGVETVKSVGTGSANYAIVDNGASGGTVTMVTAPAAGTTLVLIRDTSLTQESDYVENDPFAAETHEDALDKLQMQIQEVQEEVDRSMKISKTNTMTSTEFTNSATDRASKVLAFDSSGELSVTQELGTFRGTSATTTTAAYVVRDLVKGSTTAQLNNIYICIQASPIGTALTNTAYWTLIVDAVSAATSATTATTKASAAASSATAAAASETAAETAEAAAETAQTAAEAALDSFDDRYLGAKSSAPSTDNDGNALLTGALYFNSSTSQLFNWTAADAWEAIKPTSTEQTAINALAASAVIADMAILATDAIVADMAILATDAIVADMAILGTDAIVADMAILGTDDVVADMNVLGTADVVTDMNVLGTSANVTAMGLLGTAAVVEDLSILGTSTVVSDMATLAGSGNAPSVTNVTASGTVQFGSLSDGTITITDFVDEDNMASDSAVKIPTQQSVKAYVDSQTSGSLSLIDEDNMATDSATRPPSQQSVKAFAESLTGTNIVATGALNAGTITSGFGNIDTGASTITTTGEIAAGSLDISGNIDVDGTTNLDVVDIDGALTQDGGAVFNETGADADLRIESSGNANMLFVDGGNNKVAIGSTSANGIFDVHGTVSAGANTNQIIQRWRIGSDNVTAEMTYDDDGSNSGTFRGFNFGNVTQHDFMIKTHDSTSIHCHANGQVTMPKQPAVLALSTSAQNDIATGVVKINLDSEVYDVGGNFNTSTATFTAPRTGKYMCCGQITMSDVDTAFQWIYGRFNTSNRIYYMSVIDPRIEMSADGTHTWTFSALVDMDTNDTLVMDTRSSAHGAAQNNITASAGSNPETFMSVYLAI